MPFAVGIVDVQGATSESLRNDPYCEVIPMVVDGDTTTQIVFNTQGFNTCPRSKWKTITEDDVVAAYNSQYTTSANSANLNGRRHWVMDDIVADGGETTTGNNLTVNGLEFGQRGILPGTETPGSTPYVATSFSRSTTYIYKKGLPTFELTDNCGTTYTMQTYSQQVNPLLTYNKLRFLKRKLKLPMGWNYAVRRPNKELVLVAPGSTYVVQDIFANTYQINPDASQTRPDCTPTN